MKKFYLLLSFLTMLFECANAQWVQRQFGVRSLNELTEKQLNMSLDYMLHKRKGTIIAYSVIIPTTTAGSLILFSRVDNLDASGKNGLGATLGGTILLFTAVACLPCAAAEIITQSYRIKQIRKALGTPILKPGVSYCPFPGLGSTRNIPSFGMTVSVNF